MFGKGLVDGRWRFDFVATISLAGSTFFKSHLQIGQRVASEYTILPQATQLRFGQALISGSVWRGHHRPRSCINVKLSGPEAPCIRFFNSNGLIFFLIESLRHSIIESLKPKALVMIQ